MQGGATGEPWPDFLARIGGGELRLARPASQGDLDAGACRLGREIPEELAELLAVTNGVSGQYELAVVWPVERIVADNLMFRSHADFPSLYMPFDSLVFFGDAGNGDQFAIPQAAELHRRDVFVWNHEDDSRRWVAPSIRRYIEWWLSGQIGI
jgi:hypothetical protein